MNLNLPTNTRWLIAGISTGVFGAYLYAANMKQLSAWFDYSGQEIVNAALHGAIVVLMVLPSKLTELIQLVDEYL